MLISHNKEFGRGKQLFISGGSQKWLSDSCLKIVLCSKKQISCSNPPTQGPANPRLDILLQRTYHLSVLVTMPNLPTWFFDPENVLSTSRYSMPKPHPRETSQSSSPP